MRLELHARWRWACGVERTFPGVRRFWCAESQLPDGRLPISNTGERVNRFTEDGLSKPSYKSSCGVHRRRKFLGTTQSFDLKRSQDQGQQPNCHFRPLHFAQRGSPKENEWKLKMTSRFSYVSQTESLLSPPAYSRCPLTCGFVPAFLLSFVSHLSLLFPYWQPAIILTSFDCDLNPEFEGCCRTILGRAPRPPSPYEGAEAYRQAASSFLATTDLFQASSPQIVQTIYETEKRGRHLSDFSIAGVVK